MKQVAVACVLSLAAVGCEISPVVSAPLDSPSVRYSDCDRAAEDYCEESLQVPDRDKDSCVAEHRFECLSSGAQARDTPRG